MLFIYLFNYSRNKLWKTKFENVLQHQFSIEFYYNSTHYYYQKKQTHQCQFHISMNKCEK